jgi:hypothetical protein
MPHVDIDQVAENRARRAAKRVGLLACKSRRRRDTVDNLGGFFLIDPRRNAVVAGERCNLTADDVIEIATASAENEGAPPIAERVIRRPATTAKCRSPPLIRRRKAIVKTEIGG